MTTISEEQVRTYISVLEAVKARLENQEGPSSLWREGKIDGIEWSIHEAHLAFNIPEGF